MTLGGLINFLRRSKKTPEDVINRLVEELHETTPPIKGDVKKEKIYKLGGWVRLRTSSITQPLADKTKAEKKDREMSI